jgi:hypothetical protein
MLGVMCFMFKGFAVLVRATINFFKVLSHVRFLILCAYPPNLTSLNLCPPSLTTKSLFNLLVLFGVIFVSFSTMLYLSSRDSPGFCTTQDCSNSKEVEECETPGSYCTMGESMTKVYSLFFGTIDASDFDVPSPTLVLMFL